MKQDLTVHIIAHIETAFPTKFGIPRQSGLVPSLEGTIVFEPQYRNADALRGLEEYSHLWLLWHFSENFKSGTQPADERRWSPTVRPPRLGGNKRVGVFATRSPNRPNPIGLSSVEIASVEYDSERGPLIHVRGADLLDGTPIIDIKPYLPFTDSHPEARGGFADRKRDYALQVCDPDGHLASLPEQMRSALMQILSQDPRPSYQADPMRVYGMEYDVYEVCFSVDDSVQKLTVCALKRVR